MPAWKTGTAEEVGLAMQTFIQEMVEEFKKSKPFNITEAQTPQWMQQLASWLYSTSHIEMRYSVTYDGVAIEQLSPGTRGIVLLLLYLVIDKHDRRPLIIDQPEEPPRRSRFVGIDQELDRPPLRPRIPVYAVHRHRESAGARR
jgi:hypothetical protein